MPIAESDPEWSDLRCEGRVYVWRRIAAFQAVVRTTIGWYFPPLYLLQCFVITAFGKYVSLYQLSLKHKS